MTNFDDNLAYFNAQLSKISNKRNTWTIGVQKMDDGTHFYLACVDEDENKKDVVELVPDCERKDKHTIKLHTENWDVANMSGLEAGELAAILQISTIILLSVDYGYVPKGDALLK